MNGFFTPGSFAGSGSFTPGMFPNWVRRPGTTLEDFLTVADWDGSADINGVLTQEATGISFAKTSAAVSVMEKDFSPVLDLSAVTSFTFEFEVDNAAQISTIDIHFINVALSSAYYKTIIKPVHSTALDVSDAITTGFNRITIGKNSNRIPVTGGTPDWSVIDRIQIRVTGTTGNTPRTVWRNLTINQVNIPVAVLEFDDLYDETYDDFKAYLSSRGFVGSLGCETANLTDPVTATKVSYAQVQELVAARWDFTGQCDAATIAYGSGKTAAQIRTDIEAQRDKIATVLGISAADALTYLRGWTYNGGTAGTTSDGIAIKDILRSEYGVLHGAGDTSTNVFGLQSHENRNYMGIKGYSLSNLTDPIPEALTNYVTKIADDGCLGIFLAHAGGGLAPNTTGYEEFLDLLVTKGIAVMDRKTYISGLTVKSNGYVTRAGGGFVTRAGGGYVTRH